MKKLIYVFIIFGLVGIFLFGYQHEQVHVAVYRSYGINSSVNYFDGGNMLTTATLVGNQTCDDSCILANNIDEAIGYQLIVVYSLIYISTLIIIILLYYIYDELKFSNEIN